jgi:hypothetical protein
MTIRVKKVLWFVALGCLVAGQIHAGSEFDPCLWISHSSGEPSHGFCGHDCQSTFAAGWGPATQIVPELYLLQLTRLDSETLLSAPAGRDTETHHTRPPPLA